MANAKHLELLQQGVDAWNAWREKEPTVLPDLTAANLVGKDLNGANLRHANLYQADLREAELNRASLGRADLRGANLSRANLIETNLSRANLIETNLSKANLSRANLFKANLSKANLIEANLLGADLSGANLCEVKLIGANLRGASLQQAGLVGTDLTNTDLTGCHVYGISAWGLKLSESTKQHNLVITRDDEPAVLVDDIEVAQFIYLLLNREKLRNVIDAVTRRGILLLGRFGEGGVALLQAVAAWLRRPENGGYLPMLFDFPRPESKTYTETIRTLAGLARFVIVDLSGPSVPQEITATVDLYEIPFVPILEEARKDWSMFRDFLVKDGVLEPVHFTNERHLLELLADKVIAPAEKLVARRQRRLDKVFGRA